MSDVKYLCMRDAISKWEEAEHNKATDPRWRPLATRTAAVKDALPELRIGELTVLGGCEGHGKSALALQIALDLCEDFGNDGINERPRSIFYVSLEMDTTILMDRARKQLRLEKDEFADRASSLPLIVCDNSRVTTDELEDAVSAIATEADPKLLVVDYIQILADEAPGGNEVLKYDLISKNLKEIARRRKLHVLALASLNRSGDNYLPNNQNLRGSQQIAFNADNTVFVHQPSLSDHSLDSVWKNHAVLKVDKQRSGRAGTQHYLTFNQLTLRFEPASQADIDKIKQVPLPGSRRNFGR